MQTVAEYLGALQSERGASRNTLAAYRRDLEDFHRFLRTRRLTSTHVNAEHVVTAVHDERRIASIRRALPTEGGQS